MTHLSHAHRRRRLSALAQRLARLGAVVLTIATIALGAAHAKAQEITLCHYLSAIVQVESGCVRRDLGEIEGAWRVGGDGEVSPFQITPDVLRSIGFGSKIWRVHKDPALAESAARLWIGQLRAKHPHPADWLAAWNGGLSGYRGKAARRYADRVIALAQRLATESN